MIELTTQHAIGRYSNASELVQHLTEQAALGMGRHYFRDDRPEWMGLSKFARAGETTFAAQVRAMREGFPLGAALIEQIASDMQAPAPVSIRRRNVWTDQGDDVDMQRVWAGALDTAWRRTFKAPGFGPQRVRIVVDAIARGSMDANQMAIRGAAAVKLCDVLTAAGYSVQTTSAWRGTRNDRVFMLSVTTKDWADPVDINSLAATTVLPAFFRSLGHMWGEIIDGGTGYFVSTLDNAAAQTLLGDDDGALTFIAPQSLLSNEAATKWVNECICAVEAARNPHDMAEAA